MKHIKIGKDVLESLTTSMYEDHRSIFREYIQNSCDQIDKAVQIGILQSINEGEIYIEIDEVSKSIEITDNATGIPQKRVYDILCNIAQSTKNRDTDRGFRGIGRLAGLGYCESLIFETSYKGENTKTTMTWDAIEFRKSIYDRENHEEASLVLEKIINQTISDENINEHYFKVILKNVTQESLLDIEDIRLYLSMIAPLPMPNHFIFKSLLNEEIQKNNLTIDEYNIFVNGEKLYKLYSADIKHTSEDKKDYIYDVNFIKVVHDNELLCWGWYGLSHFKGVISKENNTRYIRLRKGNIQIGNENTLNKLFNEDKGNHYFIGEIHTFHKDLLPNARRDYFSENEMSHVFESKLKDIFYKQLYQIYRQSSTLNSANRQIDTYHEKQEEFIKKQKSNIFENKEEIVNLQEDLKKQKAIAEKATKSIKSIQSKITDENVKKVISRLTQKSTDIDTKIDIDKIKVKKPTYRTSVDYPTLTKNEQKLLGKVYRVLDGVLTKESAENVKQKLIEELN